MSIIGYIIFLTAAISTYCYNMSAELVQWYFLIPGCELRSLSEGSYERWEDRPRNFSDASKEVEEKYRDWVKNHNQVAENEFEVIWTIVRQGGKQRVPFSRIRLKFSPDLDLRPHLYAVYWFGHHGWRPCIRGELDKKKLPMPLCW